MGFQKLESSRVELEEEKSRLLDEAVDETKRLLESAERRSRALEQERDMYADELKLEKELHANSVARIGVELSRQRAECNEIMAAQSKAQNAQFAAERNNLEMRLEEACDQAVQVEILLGDLRNENKILEEKVFDHRIDFFSN